MKASTTDENTLDGRSTNRNLVQTLKLTLIV